MSIYILNTQHGKSAGKVIYEAVQSFQRKKQRRHELWVLSCYIDLDLIEKYVAYLVKSIKITDVYLAFNFAEIYKIGPIGTEQKLATIQRNLKKIGIEFEWKLLASSQLVHSKGYAIIQRSDGKLSGGAVLITSANFTEPGFKGGNIEIGYLSTKKKDLRDFINAYDYLWEEIGGGIDSAVFRQGEYLFKFALLSSGLFLHKWSGSLSQQVGIKYELTEFAKKKGTIAPELAAVGFEAGDSFTKQVLDLGELPKKEVPRSFVTRFTIETYWGRWCPCNAWYALSDTFDGADQFIKRFQSATEENVLQKIKRETLIIQEQLIDRGLIKPVGQNHLDRWINKVQELRHSRCRLNRFFTGYEAHELPYSIEQKSDVAKLFECLEEAIELTKAKNIAKEKVLSAINYADPDLIHLNDEEIQIIKEISNS